MEPTPSEDLPQDHQSLLGKRAQPEPSVNLTETILGSGVSKLRRQCHALGLSSTGKNAAALLQKTTTPANYDSFTPKVRVEGPFSKGTSTPVDLRCPCWKNGRDVSNCALHDDGTYYLNLMGAPKKVIFRLYNLHGVTRARVLVKNELGEVVPFLGYQITSNGRTKGIISHEYFPVSNHRFLTFHAHFNIWPGKVKDYSIIVELAADEGSPPPLPSLRFVVPCNLDTNHNKGLPEATSRLLSCPGRYWNLCDESSDDQGGFEQDALACFSEDDMNVLSEGELTQRWVCSELNEVKLREDQPRQG